MNEYPSCLLKSSSHFSSCTRASISTSWAACGSGRVAGSEGIMGGPGSSSSLLRGAVPPVHGGVGRGAGSVCSSCRTHVRSGGIPAVPCHRLRRAGGCCQSSGQVATLGRFAAHHLGRETWCPSTGPPGGGCRGTGGACVLEAAPTRPCPWHYSGLLSWLHSSHSPSGVSSVPLCMFMWLYLL